MNRLDSAKRIQILAALCEGVSIRAISRMTGASKNTIGKLLLEVGTVCAEFQDQALRNLPCKRVQVDEIWSFIGAKDKNVPDEHKGKFGIGSIWTWTAIDADSKLICSWLVGSRDGYTAYVFMKDLAGRLANRIQLTSDGHNSYLEAVESAFGADIDYAQLVKIYGAPREDDARYSPGECIGCKTTEITGKPERKHISTSYVERQNLTMRMHMRRFTRLTNAFSKKLEPHIAAICLHFFYYNFVRVHQTLRVTPAMAAGVTDRLWDLSDLVTMLEQYELKQAEARKADAKERNDRSYNPFGPALGH
jgi:IS1 family transposase